MKKIILNKLVLTGFLLSGALVNINAQTNVANSGNGTYKYESAKGDPLNARIYHLNNGLTVYMTVYKNAPRIQTYIATKAGSKNDPTDATGLAHYLEHMLFKGTDKYGSKDYSREKPELDKIEMLFEKYRMTRDEQMRKTLYHMIDSISGYASNFAIANEYDKMMSSIGAKGINAYTDLEQTVYVEDIPSNQLDKWTTIEAERFRNPVMRLFHTELEAVYEEKNRNLDSDGSKQWEALMSGLFPNNTYGSQTTIGTIDHLKNPSLTKIKEYYSNYYVPNNMAICLSGDFDMDETIKLIDKKFGTWAMKQVPPYKPYPEQPIAAPVEKTVVGPDAENVMIGYRFAAEGSEDADMIRIINKLLSNGTAGLMDLNLNQQQKVLDASSFDAEYKDYSMHVLTAGAKEGQKLEEVKDLLIKQIEYVKNGIYPDWMLTAIINNMELEQTKMFENNWARASSFVAAFTTGQDWAHYISTIDRLSTITKEKISAFAKEHYQKNYVVVYKRTGEDKDVQKVTKPTITPVNVNRNDQSDFVKDVFTTPSKDIAPVFIDYEKDIQKTNLKNGTQILYNMNTENKTFDMYYVFDMGTNSDKRLSVAINYLKYLGTKKYKPSEVQQEFYKLGCSYDVFASDQQTWVSLRGLSENFEKALVLFEELLSDAQPNDEALKNLQQDILKKRADAKLSKDEILWSALLNFGKYGPKSPYTNVLSQDELQGLQPTDLVDIIHKITSYEHRILYYGSTDLNKVKDNLAKFHRAPEKLSPLLPAVEFNRPDTDNKVYAMDYDMKQAEIIMLAKAETYDKSNAPMLRMFNEYFGGGMSSVVFQELRESKALAYSVFCSYSTPQRKREPYYIFSYIGAQADKLPEAMKGMMELFNNMPESENNFTACKAAILQSIRSERITKAQILFNYENAKKLGLDYDIRRDIFAKLPTLGLPEVKAFEVSHLQHRKYSTLVIGKKTDLDIKTLSTYGEVKFLTLEEIFGY